MGPCKSLRRLRGGVGARVHCVNCVLSYLRHLTPNPSATPSQPHHPQHHCNPITPITPNPISQIRESCLLLQSLTRWFRNSLPFECILMKISLKLHIAKTSNCPSRSFRRFLHSHSSLTPLVPTPCFRPYWKDDETFNFVFFNIF